MPMPDNGFKWRPNDNSAKTLLRYELEAGKWVKALHSAQHRAQPRSMAKDFLFIGMVLQLIFCVVLLILLAVLQLLQALIRWVRKKAENNGTYHEPEEVVGEKLVQVDTSRPGDEGYYKEGGTFLHNEFGRLRLIFQFIFMLVFIFAVEIAVFLFLHQYYPSIFYINEEVLIFAGCVSLYYTIGSVGD